MSTTQVASGTARKPEPEIIATTAPKTAVSAALKRNAVSPEEWQHLVAVTAYFRAEQRGFDSGSPLEDWLEAETQLKQTTSVQ